MYIQGSEIDKKFKSSLEHRTLVINSAIQEHFGDTPVRVLATQDDHAYAIDSNGSMMKITYAVKGESVNDIKSEATTDIPVIRDEDMPCFIAGQLRALVEAAVDGEEMSRTQVRDVAQMIDSDEDYWISDVLSKVEEAAEDGGWYTMYEANQEKIRTAMYGGIREIESPFPSTKFSKIAASKLSEFEDELREAINIIAKLSDGIVDECSNMVFDSDQDEFFSAICESLKVEAQVISTSLARAEKLMRTEDVRRIAEAHDGLAERAKIMAVVTAYVKGRSQHNDNEEQKNG